MATISVKDAAGTTQTVNTLPANDGSTLPVSAGSLPLPAGAATAAGVAATASADDIFTITPNDSADLGTIPKALRVTASGNLAVRGSNGTTVTIPVTVGETIPLRARRVMATGTTASVVGLV